MIAQPGSDHRQAGGCLPTARQQQLLRAATLPPDLARSAWQQWRAAADLNQLETASGRLLLWIYHRREELGLTAAEAAALEPRYRQVWLRNQVLLNRSAEVVRHLQAAGIECLLLKGLPLLIEVYRDAGGRYLEDFDLLVHRADAPRAIVVLHDLGWQAPYPETVSLAQRHGHGFYNAEGLSCDLHWNLMWRPHAPVDETPLWLAKRPLQLRDEPTFTLSVEHLLLHLCVHGMAWEAVPPIRWLLDVHLLLRHQTPQWETVLAEAHRRGVTLPLAEAVAIYSVVLPGEIPAFVAEQLQQHAPTDVQRRAYTQLVTQPTLSTILRGWRADWRTAQRAGLVPPGGRGLLQFFCRRWRVAAAWDLPHQFAQRLRRRWRSVNFFR